MVIPINKEKYMRNKIRYIRLIGLIFVLIVGSSLTFAQNKSKRKSAKKPLVEVVSIVTDEKGSPLKNVSIICGEGAVVLYTDAKGRCHATHNATVKSIKPLARPQGKTLYHR
jgi:hypothetical protein